MRIFASRLLSGAWRTAAETSRRRKMQQMANGIIPCTPFSDHQGTHLTIESTGDEKWYGGDMDLGAIEADRHRWPRHLVKAGTYTFGSEEEPCSIDHREYVEPWLAALLQADHLNLLLGNGFTTAIANAAKVDSISMEAIEIGIPLAGAVSDIASEAATRMGRNRPNIEDQIRVINELISGITRLKGCRRLGHSYE